MIRKFINAVPLIAVIVVGFGLYETPVFNALPYHSKVKVVVIVAVIWLVLQLLAAAITHQPQEQQSTRQRAPGFYFGRYNPYGNSSRRGR